MISTIKKYKSKLTSLFKRLGLTNTLLIILIILVILGLFGKNIKNIFTKIKVYDSEQTYTCKEKLVKSKTESEAYRKCAAESKKSIEAGIYDLDKVMDCYGIIKTEYVENTTNRSLSKYEYWYKFLNITYLKKEIPLELNPTFQGAYDCVIDNK